MIKYFDNLYLILTKLSFDRVANLIWFFCLFQVRGDIYVYIHIKGEIGAYFINNVT